jgi:hypothetical protein
MLGLLSRYRRSWWTTAKGVVIINDSFFEPARYFVPPSWQSQVGKEAYWAAKAPEHNRLWGTLGGSGTYG